MPATPLKFGTEMIHDPALGGLERIYVRFFGVPILGMRIRARYLLPLIDSLSTFSPRRVLDAGSGRGLFTFYLAKTFPQADVLGIDLDEEAIRRNNRTARACGLTNCRFEVMDVRLLAQEEARYDMILSVDNLEHLEEDQAQCHVFFESLAPGGRMIVHTPHITRNLFGWQRPNFMGIEGHVRPGYSLDGLTGMLENAGFEIDDVFYGYDSMETLANDISYLITGGREKRKGLYALAFPFLLFLSRLRLPRRPHTGSGLLVLAFKE